MSNFPYATLRTMGTMTATFLLTVGPWVVCTATDKKFEKVPFSIPFELWQPNAKLTANFRVAEHFKYAVALRYEYIPKNSADYARVWTLVGGPRRDEKGKLIETGAPLQIRVSVFSANDPAKPLLAEVVENPKLSSWGSALISNLVEISLGSGDYTIIVESLGDTSSFIDVKTKLSVTPVYNGK